MSPSSVCQGFGDRAVSVVAVDRTLTVGAPQVLGHLDRKGRVDHPASELGEQASGPGDLLGIQTLQRLGKGIVVEYFSEPLLLGICGFLAWVSVLSWRPPPDRASPTASRDRGHQALLDTPT